MIQLNNIHKAFGPQTIFEDLQWHIKRDQRVGLVGPNGAGKSTLIKIVMGMIPADLGTVRVSKGITVGYLPQEVAALSGTTIRAEASLGLTEVYAVGKQMRALELAMAKPGADTDALMHTYGEAQARFDALDGFTAESRVEEVLCGLGFKVEQLDRDCGTLSGGWQMRVVLARLLLQRPDILLLDEPTNHLDLESVAWLEHFLMTFPGSLVFISHDRWFLDRLATHIAELAGGTLRPFTGNFSKYLEQVEQQRDLLERQQRNQQRRVAELESFVDRFRYKASKARQVQSRVKMLEKMDTITLEKDAASIRIELPEPPKSGRVVMTLEDIHQAYGDTKVYEGLDVELIRGKHVALVGPNGAGKSTLLKLFTGTIPYQAGRRELGFQAKIYYFAQHQIEALDLNNTVLDEALEVAGAASPTKIRSVLGAFLFDSDDCGKKVEVLSGGEKNRLALVKMLLTPANVLLLDEPTTHLDMASRAVLEAALSDYSGTVVLISHDRHFIDGVCDEVWEVNGGRITPFVGDYTEYQARVARGDRPQPLPLHNRRRKPANARRSPTAPKPVEAAPPAAEAEKPTVDWGGGDVGLKRRSRDDKRRDAQARQQAAAKLKPLKTALTRAEGQVATLEAELAALHAQQADPAHYNDAEQVKATALAAAQTEQALTQAYGVWEGAAAAVEAAEAELDG